MPVDENTVEKGIKGPKNYFYFIIIKLDMKVMSAVINQDELNLSNKI